MIAHRASFAAAVLVMLAADGCDSAQVGTDAGGSEAGALTDAMSEDVRALDGATDDDGGSALDLAMPPQDTGVERDLGPPAPDGATGDADASSADAGMTCTTSCPCTAGSPITLDLPSGAAMLRDATLDATDTGWIYAASHALGVSVWMLDDDGGVVHANIVSGDGEDARVAWHSAAGEAGVTYTGARTPPYSELYFARLDDETAVIGDELAIEDSAMHAAGAGEIVPLDEGWAVAWLQSSVPAPVRYRHVGADGSARTEVTVLGSGSPGVLGADVAGGNMQLMWATGISAVYRFAEARPDGGLAFGPSDVALIADGIDLVARGGGLAVGSLRVVGTNEREVVMATLDRDRGTLTDLATVSARRPASSWVGGVSTVGDRDGWALAWSVRDDDGPGVRPTLWFARVNGSGAIRTPAIDVGATTGAATLATRGDGRFAMAYLFDSGSGPSARFLRVTCPE